MNNEISAPEQHRASFRFGSANFTQIPNDVLNLVLEGKLKHRDVTVYAYLLAKAAVAELAFKKPYAAVPIKKMSKELGLSLTTIKSSLQLLSDANVIERVDTPGYTRTLILIKVRHSRIVRFLPDQAA